MSEVSSQLESVVNDPAETRSVVSTADDLVRERFEYLKRAYEQTPYMSYAERRAHLDVLCDVLRSNQHTIAEAIAADFGVRSLHETRLAEIFLPVAAIRYIRSHLRAWMKSQPRRVPLSFQLGSAKVVYQPLGVVGIIAPWNYPFHLAVMPAAFALAAGNRVLLKPSELTPHTAELLRKLVSERFNHEVMSVVTGGRDVAEAFSKLPFDHIFFTGSTQVGRMFPFVLLQFSILYFLPSCTFTHSRSNHSSCLDENAHTSRSLSFDCRWNATPYTGSTIGNNIKLYGRAISHSPSISRTLYVVT
jgi:acyl-CoA reductase-like NAD-dependent aldehyde dehydrogenase